MIPQTFAGRFCAGCILFVVLGLAFCSPANDHPDRAAARSVAAETPVQPLSASDADATPPVQDEGRTAEIEEGMLFATRAIAILGAGSLLLSGIGIVLILRTLVATQDTLFQATLATTAAQATAEIARAGESAYVLPEITVNYSGLYGRTVAVKVRTRNFGRTPARNVSVDILYGTLSEGVFRNCQALARDQPLGAIGAGAVERAYQGNVVMIESAPEDRTVRVQFPDGVGVIVVRVRYTSIVGVAPDPVDDAKSFDFNDLSAWRKYATEDQAARSTPVRLSSVTSEIDVERALCELDALDLTS